jgi:hypothetical protein
VVEFIFNPHVSRQILTGKVPYHYLSENRVFYAVSKGIRPLRPSEPLITDVRWKLIQLCWDRAQRARPSIREIHYRVTGFHRDCMDVSSSVPQEPVPMHFPVIKRHLRPPPTNQFDAQLDSLASSRTTYSGRLSEREGNTMYRQHTDEPPIIQPTTSAEPAFYYRCRL